MQNFIETIRFCPHKILTNDSAFIDNIVCPCGGMVDAVDSKSTVRKDVGVQVSPGVPSKRYTQSYRNLRRFEFNRNFFYDETIFFLKRNIRYDLSIGCNQTRNARINTSNKRLPCFNGATTGQMQMLKRATRFAKPNII